MKWVDRQEEFDAALDATRSQAVVAVDTEADSLHSYFDKVCLIQMTVSSEDFVIDPLAKIDLARFGAMLNDASIRKVFHGGDYDLRIMNRDFGWVVRNLVDTSVCAQLLGYEAFGLAALLERHFGVKVNKAHQRADWAMRPLPPDMLAYAAMDTRYLAALAERLEAELRGLGRWEWALEESDRMESIRFREAEEDSEPWRKMKNISGLDRRALAVLHELYLWRDALARRADRPTFRVIGNESIIDIAKEKPPTVRELASIKSVSKYHSDRYGGEIVRLVRTALERPEESLPERGERKPWIRDKALEARIEKLKKVRDRFAKELGIEASILAPRHVLSAIATEGHLDVPAMRNWQKSVMGEELKKLL
ncbi:MAG: ribonuclease D [Thermoanaerobaculia bacterium]